LKTLTVSGPPGSGTSTACRLLAERLGRDYVNAGQIFRQLAADAGLSLAEYGRRAEADGGIDRQLDARMVEIVRRQGQVILEGRLTGWMAHRHGLPAFKVWLDAPFGVRALRVSQRDGQPLSRALADMAARERSEAVRYAAHHGIDIGDLSIYDLVIDTERTDPPAVADRILAGLQE
jgi:CMP/dCMP kinase